MEIPDWIREYAKSSHFEAEDITAVWKLVNDDRAFFDRIMKHALATETRQSFPSFIRRLGQTFSS